MAELVANFTLDTGENFDALFEINASGTTWGSIQGNIENQTDLYNILLSKADTATVQSDLETINNTISENYETLDGKIDTVQSDLSGDISVLSNTVNTNYTELSTAIQNETAARADNDSLLQGDINTEALARQNADTTLQGNIDTLSNTVTSNYTTLDGRITTNTNNISSINNTLSDYGNIVTHNVSEFATAAQGALADTALQSGDNITELNNNAGYITSSAIPTLEDLTTPAQLNAINSGATSANIGQITTNANNISDIEDLIPNQATTSNQLADKDFVNSSIATNTAYFIGTFNSVAELEAYSGTLTNNDYAFVATTDQAGNTLYDRYKWNGTEWLFEYELNNSSFTAVQWAAINSGITSSDVSHIATNTANIATKQDIINDLATIRSGAALGATSLQPNDNISELTNNVGYITNSALNGYATETYVDNGLATKQGTLTAGTGIDITSNVISTDALRNLATGNYALTIFGTSTAAQQATNVGQGSIAGGFRGTSFGANAQNNAQYGTAVGYVAKINSSSTNSIQIGSGTTTSPNQFNVGFNGIDNYLLLDGTTGLIPDARISDNIARTTQLPTVNNGTLTIQANGTTVGTFTANQSGDTTANIVVPDSATWGNITGTLSNQTDLQTALNNADEIFDVTYSTTTYSEISTALTNGKLPVCQYNSKSYVYSMTASNVHYFTAVYIPYVYVLRFHSGAPYWSTVSATIEQTSNKVTTLSGSSTNTQYPSAKCVYDALQEVGGTVDQTYDGTSANAQSGTAVAEAVATKTLVTFREWS